MTLNIYTLGNSLVLHNIETVNYEKQPLQYIHHIVNSTSSKDNICRFDCSSLATNTSLLHSRLTCKEKEKKYSKY